jgi:hypothetical protein
MSQYEEELRAIYRPSLDEINATYDALYAQKLHAYELECKKIKQEYDRKLAKLTYEFDKQTREHVSLHKRALHVQAEANKFQS